jgi:hypothetical protein
VHGQRTDGNGVEADGGAERERVSWLVIQQDAAGIRTGGVGKNPNRCLQTVRQVEVSGG